MAQDVVSKQFKQPRGILGFIVSKIMDVNNRVEIDWVSSLLEIVDREKILEIGYGSGILISDLALMQKDIAIYGVDFSDVMYRRACRRNKRFIEGRRVTLSCSDILSYDSRGVRFDKIIAINVIYFWNDLPGHLMKIHTLLNDSGKVYFYMVDPAAIRSKKLGASNVFNDYSVERVVDELTRMNFKNAAYLEQPDAVAKAYCVTAEK